MIETESFVVLPIKKVDRNEFRSTKKNLLTKLLLFLWEDQLLL